MYYVLVVNYVLFGSLSQVYKFQTKLKKHFIAMLKPQMIEVFDIP